MRAAGSGAKPKYGYIAITFSATAISGGRRQSVGDGAGDDKLRPVTLASTDSLDPGADIPRHRHQVPYAAVVLSGGYEEAGDGGRWRAEAGDVLIHAPFSTHLDRAPRNRTVVLNLPLPWLWAPTSSRMRVDDPDAVARLAERDARDAAVLLLTMLQPGAPALQDDADLLAGALSDEAAPQIAAWSQEAEVTRQTAWRRFAAAYGVGPARFRVEARARRTWRRLVDRGETLSAITAAEGFADQAHMTRDIRSLTGRTPGWWRAERHSFKTRAE